MREKRHRGFPTEVTARSSSFTPAKLGRSDAKRLMSNCNESLNPDFLGGPPELFEIAGREQLIVLLQHGMTFKSTVLDIGCGCLRAGRWIIPLLDPGHYCGLEPMPQMIKKGLETFIDPETVAHKRPRFDNNDRFDFSVFEKRFTHFIARSIWTHASKQQIETMLDGVARWGTSDAVLLASFLPATLFGRKDYSGSDWVGRSHVSEARGTVAHRFSWIKRASQTRGMTAEYVNRPPLRPKAQVWVAIRKV